MISVIIPCYRSAKTITACCESLFTQTYQQFELILLDDGSDDGTFDVLQDIKTQHPDQVIRLERHDNCGVSTTRNKGLSLARGEFIAFVDADDWVYPSYLEALLKGFEHPEVDLSVVGVEKSHQSYPDKVPTSLTLSKEMAFDHYFTNQHVKGYMWNKLYRASIIRQQALTFNSDLSIMEDLEFNLRYWQFVNKVALTDERLYHYVIGETSAMTSAWSDSKLSMLAVFEQILTLPNLTERQKELVLLDYVRSLLWLIGQLYRKGSSDDVSRQEAFLLDKLVEHKLLFIRKGYQCGLKYYLSYLLFSCHPSLLKSVIR